MNVLMNVLNHALYMVKISIKLFFLLCFTYGKKREKEEC